MENMEFRPSPLPEPERGEEAPDPFREKVEAWLVEYESMPKNTTEPPYETPAEIAQWFDSYKAQKEEIRNKYPQIGRDGVRKEMDALEMEHTKKLKDEEYQLFALREEAKRSEERAGELGDQIKKIETKLQKRFREEAEEKWWEEHKNEIPPRNVLTHFNETATAIANVEGLGWARYQKDKDDYSLLGALKYLDRIKEMPDRESHTYELYGDGGWNRWMIKGDGSVYVDAGRSRAMDQKLPEKAACRGFGVW